MPQDQHSPPPPPRVRVLCIDPDAAAAVWLREAVEASDDLEWAGLLTTASNLTSAVRNNRPTVVLIDPDTPGAPPLPELLATLAQLGPAAIIHTARSPFEAAQTAVKLGAAGFIAKGPSTAAVLLAVREVAAGRRVVIRSRAGR